MQLERAPCLVSTHSRLTALAMRALTSIHRSGCGVSCNSNRALSGPTNLKVRMGFPAQRAALGQIKFGQ
jgi:hypothetical protein